jgi:hypothetical protein
VADRDRDRRLNSPSLAIFFDLICDLFALGIDSDKGIHEQSDEWQLQRRYMQLEGLHRGPASVANSASCDTYDAADRGGDAHARRLHSNGLRRLYRLTAKQAPTRVMHFIYLQERGMSFNHAFYELVGRPLTQTVQTYRRLNVGRCFFPPHPRARLRQAAPRVSWLLALR